MHRAFVSVVAFTTGMQRFLSSERVREKAHHRGGVDRNHPAVRAELVVESAVESIGALNGFIVRRNTMGVLMVREREQKRIVQCNYMYTQRRQR